MSWMQNFSGREGKKGNYSKPVTMQYKMANAPASACI